MRRFPGLAAAALLLLAGCATPPRDPAALAVYRANDDPLEPLNRKVFAFNQVVQRILFRPIAEAYVRVIPAPGRDGVHHFLGNLGEPIIFVNDALQGGFKRAGRTACRFVINSTVGVGGLLDIAGMRGIPRQTGDFGQTLHTWGVPGGPYLVLPIVGPSNPRDGVGVGVDIYLDPWRYVERANNYPTGLSVALFGATGLDEYARSMDQLDALQRESVDYYAAFRSLYRQHRAGELGAPAASPAAPAADFYNDADADTPAPAAGNPKAASP